MVKHYRSQRRNVHGILLLDKPTGITSNEALQCVKRLFRARKAGHTGSLDKMASGLLPLCFGEATKFSGFLLNANKRYLVSCRLGIETSTGDALGEIVAENAVEEFSIQTIEQVLQQFKGAVEQVPPMYSAVKHKGKRLYELAYQGIEVERKARLVTIHQITLLNYTGELLELDVTCSKGTYIRTLVEDIGKQLGCSAHVCALKRIEAGPYHERDAISITHLEQLAEAGMDTLDAQLLSVDSALQEMPSVELTKNVACYLCEGQAVIVPHAPTQGMLRIYNDQNTFLGIGEVLDDGRIAPKRLITQ